MTAMVFLPFSDRNHRIWIAFHYVTVGLIALCTLAFAWEFAQTGDGTARIIYGLGMIPAVITGQAQLPPELVMVPSELTLITSLFLHGGFWHLIGNMLFLWVFGDNIEDAMGHRRFVAFFLLCGLLASLVHVWADPSSEVPTIGASGAISGVLGAYFVLHPKARIWVLLLSVIPMQLPTYAVIGGWVAFNLFNAVMVDSAASGVAWWAHIGGFVAGAAMIRFFKHEHVPLWDVSGDARWRIRGLTLPSERGGGRP
jgi:membrane associated rhomboid family serine protease